MALGSKVDVGARKATTVPIRQTIQYIREIVQNHSDDEIYAALKETNMDPDETAEKLLSQDPFHEVKRKKDKKKENAGHAKSQNHGQHIKWSSSVSASEPSNAAQSMHVQTHSSQNIHTNARNVLPGIARAFRVVRDNRVKENVGCTGSENGQAKFNISEKRPTERKLQSHGQVALPGSNGGHIKNPSLVDTTIRDCEDPVSLGAIRCEIGASTSQQSLPSSTIQSAGHAGGLHKNFHSTYTSASVPIIPGVSSVRNSFSNQYANKLHQQTVGLRKVVQSKMEWKPKVPQQLRTSISGVLDGASAPLSHSGNTEENGQSFCLAEKKMVNVECVVIPQHLLVPEKEKKHITFGSFGAVDPAISNEEDTVKQFTESASAAVFVETGEGTSIGVQVDSTDGLQASCLDSEEPVTSEQGSSESTRLGAHNAVGYSTDGMVKNGIASYGSMPQKQLENSPRLPKLSEAFESQHDYDASSFITAATEDNMGQLGLASQPEVLHSHVQNSELSNTVTPQMQSFAQQQQVGQLYPQVQLPHYTNFVPYRQLVSPVYVPPMAVPNYSSGAAYAHPPNGSSYLLMPSGNPQIAAAVKYAQSQYKAVAGGNPTGYGNFTNAAGYSISAPGTMGAATGVDDATRIKYKDNNLYVPSAQVETSELWMQNQRDSAQYYNLSPQAPHAYLPSNAGHAQAQLPPIQYSGVYHPQPTATANPHHLVHQQVPPGMSGNIGVNVMAPTPQVGAYQQPQLGHLNWTNF